MPTWDADEQLVLVGFPCLPIPAFFTYTNMDIKHLVMLGPPSKTVYDYNN